MINQKEISFANRYVKAPVQILDIPFQIEIMKKPDDNEDEVRFYTTREYINIVQGHKIVNINDNYFIKGFGFSRVGIKEFKKALDGYGLVEGANIWIMSLNEVREELLKDEWNNETVQA